MRIRFVALALLCASLLAAPARAQETQPGDACATADLHRSVGGIENPGAGYSLVCDGSIWKAITTWDTATGQSLFQVDNDAGACDAIKLGRIRYNGTSTWEYCNGTNWINLLSGATATPAGNSGEIQFYSGGSLGASSNLFWDNASSELGIGIATP